MFFLIDILVQLWWCDESCDSKTGLKVPWERPFSALKQQVNLWGKQVSALEKR